MFSQQKQVVLDVMKEIGISDETLKRRTIEVWNKVDLLPRVELLEKLRQTVSVAPVLSSGATSPREVIPISATEQLGFDRLLNIIETLCLPTCKRV